MFKSDNQQKESERITSHRFLYPLDLLSPLYLFGHPYTLSVKNVVGVIY
jgi:hypothetical protein